MLNLFKINYVFILERNYSISPVRKKHLKNRSFFASALHFRLMRHSKYRYSRLLIAVVLSCAFLDPAFAQKTVSILVVTSSNDEPFRQAVAGFKEQIAISDKINYTEYSMQQAQGKSDRELEGMKLDLIYALGGEASRWAVDITKKIPIVATLVLSSNVFTDSANMTGVSLNYPLSTQFEWLKKFFPQQKTVAILYNPTENAGTIETARQLSQKGGFSLIAIPVESPKKLPYALEQLANNIEILLAIPDETVMSVATAKEVLLASFRNKVPLVGLSDNWVKSGALYALSWDYPDLGKQCADMAKKLLSGTPVKNVRPEFPRKVAYTINAKIAEHMNLEIPDDLLNNARSVFN